LFAPIRVVLVGNICVLHVYIFMRINDDDDDMVQLMPLHPKTPSSLASFKSRLVYLSCTCLPRLSWKRGLAVVDPVGCKTSA